MLKKANEKFKKQLEKHVKTFGAEGKGNKVALNDVFGKVWKRPTEKDINKKIEESNELAKEIGFDGATSTHFVDILQKLSKLTIEKEAELTEINPLVVLKDGSLLALDGKIMTDDIVVI